MLFKLEAKFKPAGDQPKAIEKLTEGLKKNFDFQTLLGVTGSGKTFTMANVIKNFDRPVLVIAPNKALAAQLYREYKNFFPKNSVNYFVSYYDYYQPEAYLPITDTYIDKEAMINDEIDKLRHQATSNLLRRRDTIIVASVSCIYNLGTPASYLEASLHLEKERSITRGDLISQLVKIQFTRSPNVLERGKFRVRGDVFEIMPPSEGEILYQIIIKDQKIEEINILDNKNRNVLENLKEIIIFPPKHFISSGLEIKNAIKNIRAELKERLKFFRQRKLYLEEERLERRTRYDMEMIKSIGYCHGIENYSRHLTGKGVGEPPDTLLSYFPKKDFITIIDESHIAVPQIRGMYEGDRARKEVLIEYGWRLPSALDNRPLKFNEFLGRVGPVIFTSATPGTWEEKKSAQIAEQIIRPTYLVDPAVEIRSASRQIDDVIKELEKIVKNNERAIINTLTKKMAEELTDYLAAKKFKVNFMHSDTKTLERIRLLNDFKSGEFDILVGVNLLREGLDFPEVTLVAILDADREGFLRSETSLIQTMGRAARNVKGKIILYADLITGSIKRAIETANRRRRLQLAHNKKFKKKPKSIKIWKKK